MLYEYIYFFLHRKYGKWTFLLYLSKKGLKYKYKVLSLSPSTCTGTDCTCTCPMSEQYKLAEA